MDIYQTWSAFASWVYSVFQGDGGSKALISLLSVVVGWSLSQSTNLWRERRLKRALPAEVEDLVKQSDLLIYDCERKWQLFAHGAIEPDLPLKVTNHIFLKHYADICVKLNPAQRESFRLIHGYVDAANRTIEQLNKIREKHLEDQTLDPFDDWKSTLLAHYQHSRLLQWHARFHLKYKNNPDIGGFGSERHKEILKVVDESFVRAEKHIQAAKSIPIEELLPSHHLPKQNPKDPENNTSDE